MKSKKLSYLIVGALLVIMGVLILVTEHYWNGITSKRVSNILKGVNVELNASDFRTESDTSTKYTNNVKIEALSDDQVIQGISVYKNAIEIPSVNIAVQVNEGLDTEALHAGAGHFEDTANIGEDGNFAICGHASETYRCIFNSLDKVNLYDKIYAYDLQGNKFVYTVTDMNIVQPNDWSVVYDGADSNEKLMTIITCCDNGQRRFVVKAQVLTDEEVEALIATRKSLNLKTASNYNKLEEVSSLYDYFVNNDCLSLKKYCVSNAVIKERDSIRCGLYSAILGDNVKLKEHKYPINYNINIGFSIDK